MAIAIVCLDSTADNGPWLLSPGQYTIGRDPTCQLVVSGDATVQPLHARLTVTAESLRLEPVAAEHVRVDGEPVDGPRELRPGLRFALGETVFAVSDRPLPAPPPTGPESAIPLALPPPDPPRWQAVARLLLLLATVAGVTAAVQLAPRRFTTETSMPPEVAERVRAATVWIRCDGGESEGSGYVAAADRVLTNAHVVTGSKAIEVIFNAGTDRAWVARASIRFAGQPGTPLDIALLTVNTGGAPVLPLARIESLREGEPVTAYGFPLGSSLSTSGRGPNISIRSGRVTALRRANTGRIEWIESDLPAEVGNSGGPLVNQRGEVVGLATMLVGPHLRTVLAVPADRLKAHAQEAPVASE